MERIQNRSRVIILITLIITLAVATASLFALAITGFYPGIVVLWLLSIIRIASTVYANKIVEKSQAFQRNFCRIVGFVNLFTLLVVLWMTFVILVDRVFTKVL